MDTGAIWAGLILILVVAGAFLFACLEVDRVNMEKARKEALEYHRDYVKKPMTNNVKKAGYATTNATIKTGIILGAAAKGFYNGCMKDK